MVGKGWLRALAVVSIGLVGTVGVAPATQAANRTSSSGGYSVSICTASHFVQATNTCSVSMNQLTLNQFYRAYISITGSGVRSNRAELVMSPNQGGGFISEGSLPEEPDFCRYSSPQTHGACAGSVSRVIGFLTPTEVYQLQVVLWPYRSGPVASTSLWLND